MSRLLENGLKISLGAGRVKIPGYLSVDIDPEAAPDIVMDISHLEFTEGQLGAIYASHVLEHLKPPGDGSANRWGYLLNILKSWRRCLQNDGVLRISVPDMEKLASIFCSLQDEPNLQKISLDAIFGGARNKFDFHYSGFTKLVLSELLYAAGFEKVETFSPFVDDESTHKIIGENISLNLVAYRSGTQPTSDTADFQTEKKSTNELALYRDAADDRLREIRMLKAICDERDIALKNVSRVLKDEQAYLAKIHKNFFFKILKRFI